MDTRKIVKRGYVPNDQREFTGSPPDFFTSGTDVSLYIEEISGISGFVTGSNTKYQPPLADYLAGNL